MQLPSILALLALAASTAKAQAFANGAYSGITLSDGGTMVIQSVDSPELPPITLPPSFDSVSRRSPNPASAAIEKRFTACWHTGLDRSGTDITIQALQDWANVPGGRTLRSGSSNYWFGFVYEEVITYYCIDAEYASGNIDLEDVNHAVWQMDQHCVPYTASYFQWDGTPEIIGKIRAGTTICIG